MINHPDQARYEAAIRRVADLLRLGIDAGMRPEFLMPPMGIVVAAPLSYFLRRIAKNADAVSLGLTIVNRLEDNVTLMQLDVALQLEGVKVQRAKTLDAIGIQIAGVINPDAGLN